MPHKNTIKNDIYAKIIIAGGGTGGHIFPALAIANGIKERNPYADILFVGSKHRMEMQRIPEAGFPVIGLDITGINRKNWLKNIFLIVKVFKSFIHSYRIIKKFRPSAVIGVGGYSSFPLVRMAQLLKIPTLIQEQNSYAGLANRILGKRADIICTAYEEVHRFFNPSKVLCTGNPVRSRIKDAHIRPERACTRFGLKQKKTTILVIGGSLGSGKINKYIAKQLPFFAEYHLQLIWQVGKAQYKRYLTQCQGRDNVYVTDFIENIEEAYAAADIIISRAGALAMAELAQVGKPVIFIPLPNAVANHQYHNAQSLYQKNACLLIEEKDIETTLSSHLITLVKDAQWQKQLREKIRSFARPKATQNIIQQVFRLCARNAPALKKAYFIGIGGAGMRSLAQHLYQNNVHISGYDKTATPYTEALQKQGITLYHQPETTHIQPDLDWVVYTPALPADFTELKAAKKHNLPLLKRSFVLGHITRYGYNICVSGTHGKTSTSALIACMLRTMQLPCNEFIGGTLIDPQYIPRKNQQHETLSLIEADEFDRSFLQLDTDIGIITSMEADHLDIYHSEEQMQEAYITFVKNIREKGALILHHSLLEKYPFHQIHPHTITYSMDHTEADYHIQNLSIHDTGLSFDVYQHRLLYTTLHLPPTALFNVENALAALICAQLLDIPKSCIQESLARFTSVKRRFEVRLTNPKTLYIDDYAHHPTEIRRLLGSVRQLYPKRKVCAVFQPHLFSRTRDFHPAFAQALDLADEVILLPVYAAREAPLTGVSSALIAQHIKKKCRIFRPSELLAHIQKNKKDIDILLTIGAGDIDTLAEPIINILT